MTNEEYWRDRLDATKQEKAFHGLYGFPLAVYIEDLAKDAVQLHWHFDIELILVDEGEGIFLHDNDGDLVLKKGEGLFVNSEKLHGCWCTESDNCKISSIVFNPYFVSGGPDSVLWTKYISPLIKNENFEYCILRADTDWQKEVISLIEKAVAAIKDEKDGYEFSSRTYLSQILYLLHKNMEHSPKKASEKTLRNINRLKLMIDYVQSNFAEDLKINDIAKAAMISESECLRCFKKQVGISPIKYVTDVRLQKACELLKTTDFSVNKISELCGFSDNSYFGKAFKKEKGMTPLEFRKKL